MIKFFRKIRYDLMRENKTGTYLKYAIGEIVLVVIGILIALSINNWNEERAVKMQELSILKEIKRNIDNNVIELDGDIVRSKRRMNSFNVFLAELKRKKPNNDTILIHFRRLYGGSYFNGDNSGYELLRIKGADVNLPDDLRYSINYYFDEIIEDLELRFSTVRQQHRDYMVDIYRNNFEPILRDSTGTFIGATKDYSFLAKDDVFITSIHLYYGQNNSLLNNLNISKEQSEALLAELDNYLNNAY